MIVTAVISTAILPVRQTLVSVVTKRITTTPATLIMLLLNFQRTVRNATRRIHGFRQVSITTPFIRCLALMPQLPTTAIAATAGATRTRQTRVPAVTRPITTARPILTTARLDFQLTALPVTARHPGRPQPSIMTMTFFPSTAGNTGANGLHARIAILEAITILSVASTATNIIIRLR